MRLRAILPWLVLAACDGCPSATPAPPPPMPPPPAPVEPAPPEPEPPSLEGRTRLVLLGTGTPNPDPRRSGPSLAVVVDDVPYLVDMGPGVVRRAESARRNGVEGLAPERIEHVFVTHLHSDHTVGFPDLVFTPWVVGRAAPLHVHGPPGMAAMSEHVTAAWAEDVRIRTEGLEGANRTGHEVRAHELEPGEVYRDERVRVVAFEVPHGSWRRAFGYRFETPDRTIVVSGDTGPGTAVADACDGCDVLVHEVYSEVALSRRPPEWQRYHRAFHTSSVELGEVATRARPALLVLYHHLLWGTSPDELVAEVRAGWDGEVAFGEDLDVF